MKFQAPVFSLVLCVWSAVPIFSVYAQGPFVDCVINTGTNATVAISASANLSFNGARLIAGDEIAVYNSSDLCVGKVIWQGASAALTVWGDNDQTSDIDGLQAGEEMEYRVWQQASSRVGTASVTYSQGNGRYQADGLYVLETLEAWANAAPSAAVITSPANGGLLTLVGDPNTSFTATWTMSVDPEGDSVSYTWQLSMTEDFSDGMLLLSQNVGQSTSFQTTYGVLATLLSDKGVRLNDTITLFQRVVSSDGMRMTLGKAEQVIFVRGALTKKDQKGFSRGYSLDDGYPNPFSTSTTIRYFLPETIAIKVEVFDVLGRSVSILVDEIKPSGTHSINFDAFDLPDGIYVVQLIAGKFYASRKVIRLR